jgi:hypothetical protein
MYKQSIATLFNRGWSFRRTLVFWWGLYLVVQQAERFFLLNEAWSVEPPTIALLARTLWTGMRADLIVATIGVLLAAFLGMLIGLVWGMFQMLRAGRWSVGPRLRPGFTIASWGIAVVLMTGLIVDMGYFHYNKQHLDFVFFEYVDDLITHAREIGGREGQAVQQTSAELQGGEKWGLRVLAFLGLELCAVIVWWTFFIRALAPLGERWRTVHPALAHPMLALGLVAGVTGFHHQGPYAIRLAQISSGMYYTLAQNPILYASEALRETIDSRFQEDSRMRSGRGLDRDWVELPELPGQSAGFGNLADLQGLTEGEALQIAQGLLARGEHFPYPRYPLVRSQGSSTGVALGRASNVLIIFVEALDRRYLGQTVNGVRLTPFLDRLKSDSVFFENFFANGAQTARGLFATFCSYYPRRGVSAMKARYAYDYLCLPTLLKKAGYHTEMIISSQRDIDRLHLFLSRNGMDQVLDENDFPPGTERIGANVSLGKPDGALLDLIRDRMSDRQRAGRPFLLAAKTLTMHHPFYVPGGHLDVETLRSESDGYFAALRYFDLELERFFAELEEKDLLRNTVVFILGDHGRHEHVGETAIEKQVGHFLTPLFVWMDPSLRTPDNYRPRTVTTVASQVDLTPTILAMNGLMPRLTPFLGQDISCLLVADCLQDNFAFLISPYGDEAIGLADRDGILLYGLRTQALTRVSLRLEQIPDPLRQDPQVRSRDRQLMGLYISANAVLDRNMIWSWKELGSKL